MIYLEADTQELVEAIAITKEPAVDTEATLGKNEGLDTQEPSDEVVVT